MPPTPRASLLSLALFGCSSATVVPATRDAAADAVSSLDVGADAAPIDGASPDASTSPTNPTYWAHVAPILQQQCTQCHTVGGLGPFPLDAYASARAQGESIARSVTDGSMPPWMPASTCRPLQHARVLPPSDIATLQRWVSTGMAEGDRASFVARPGTVANLPDRASLTVQPTEPYVPPRDRMDDYHCFVMDPALTTARDLIGVRFTPGEPRTVHHVIVYEIKQAALDELQRLDDAEPGPGYTCFGGPRVNAGGTGQRIQFVAGWAPGGPPLHMPPGTGIRLSPGSRLVMQVHYNQANGRDLSDRTRTELFFSDQPVSRVAYVIPLAQTSFTVPAGARETEVIAEAQLRRYGVPLNATIYGVSPHMHTLGTSATVEVERAGGAGRECMIDIPRWDFHWQQFYLFEEPMRITPDDTIRVRCHFDNTPARQPIVDGIQQPPRDVHWGEGTFDEMCINFFYATVP